MTLRSRSRSENTEIQKEENDVIKAVGGHGNQKRKDILTAEKNTVAKRKKKVGAIKEKLETEIPEAPETELMSESAIRRSQKRVKGSGLTENKENICQNEAENSSETNKRSSNCSKLLMENSRDIRAVVDAKEHVGRMFCVELIISEDKDGITGNIEIVGNDENCLLCKEYLLALTEPGCRMTFDYSPEKHDLISTAAVHEKLERDSQTVIVFLGVGRLEVRGLDSLSVALALSSLENLLEEHGTIGLSSSCDAHGTSASRRSSILLNKELESLAARSDQISENYRSANDAVKFSILSVVKDERREERVGLLSSPSVFPSSLNQISDAYQSFLDDSCVKVSPSVTKDHPCIENQISEAYKSFLDDSCVIVSPSLTKDRTSIENGLVMDAKDLTKDLILSNVQPSRELNSEGVVGDNTVNEGASRTPDGNSESHAKDLSNAVDCCCCGDGTDQTVCSATDKTADDEIKPFSNNTSGSCVSEKSIIQKQESNSAGSCKTPKEKFQVTSSNVESERNSTTCLAISSATSQPAVKETRKVFIKELPVTRKVVVPEMPVTRSNSYCLPRQPYSNRPPVSGACEFRNFNHAMRMGPVTRSTSYCLPRQPFPNQPPVSGACEFRNFNHAMRMTSCAARRRYVVIDGSNVAMAHGRHKVFSCPGIEICIQYFLDRGHNKDQITAFVPQSRLARDQNIVGQHLLTKLADHGLVIFTPARQFPGRRIVCYDDRYILRLAARTGGIVVSNDNYRDLWHEHEWRHVIETSLLPFSFVHNMFMPPDDPLGSNGPNLDQFLTVNISRCPGETMRSRYY